MSGSSLIFNTTAISMFYTLFHLKSRARLFEILDIKFYNLDSKQAPLSYTLSSHLKEVPKEEMAITFHLPTWLLGQGVGLDWR